MNMCFKIKNIIEFNRVENILGCICTVPIVFKS